MSSEHAAVFWSHGRWMVRDLGSSNGTMVNGRRLESGKPLVLEPGAELCFGSREKCFVLTEGSPPNASAHCPETGETVQADDDLLVLPGPEEPIVSVFRNDCGDWWIEQPSSSQAGQDQQVVALQGRLWVLQLPPKQYNKVATTRAHADSQQCALDTATLRFKVSRDEEYVELACVGPAGVTFLGTRTFNYMLLTMARARLRDREQGDVPEAEEGWLYVDELATMLTTDRTQINLRAFRARKQLLRAGIVDAGQLIERRAASGQIRIGTTQIEITRPHAKA